MADELLDLELDTEEPNAVEKRIKDLSNKTRTAYEERDAIAKAKADEEAARQKAEKERDFYKGFSTIASKHPGAAEFQDKILEKVNSGYDLEDATVAVLAKEGKFVPPAVPETPAPPVGSPAGGSAANSIKSSGEKPVGEMSQAEKRAILEKELGLS